MPRPIPGPFPKKQPSRLKLVAQKNRRPFRDLTKTHWIRRDENGAIWVLDSNGQWQKDRRRIAMPAGGQVSKLKERRAFQAQKLYENRGPDHRGLGTKRQAQRARQNANAKNRK